jgi:hypothetical protein
MARLRSHVRRRYAILADARYRVPQRCTHTIYEILAQFRVTLQMLASTMLVVSTKLGRVSV